MPQAHANETPRQKVLYQLEKANYYPIKHHILLEKLPASVTAAILLDTMIQLETEGLVDRIIAVNRGHGLCLYTLTEKYALERNFQIPGFKPNV